MYIPFTVVDEEGKARYFMRFRSNFGSMNAPGLCQRFTGDLFTRQELHVIQPIPVI